jgi:hypothetical protein
MMTCGGKRLPAVNSIRTMMLNFQLNWVQQKATIDDSSNVRMTPGTTMTRVLR